MDFTAVSKKQKIYQWERYSRKQPKCTGKHEKNNDASKKRAAKKTRIFRSASVLKKDLKRSENTKKNEAEKKVEQQQSQHPEAADSGEASIECGKSYPAYEKSCNGSKIKYLPSDCCCLKFPTPITSPVYPEIGTGQFTFCTDHCHFVKNPMPARPWSLGFVGIGQLARPLIAKILKAGIRVLLWNRTASKCDEFKDFGAIICKTPEEVASDCDITFCTVLGGAAINTVCLGGITERPFNGILEGFNTNPREEKDFVMMTSITPATSRLIGERCRDLKVNYLEAQVTVNSQVENTEIIVVCAGSREVFKKLPVCMASTEAKFMFASNAIGPAEMAIEAARNAPPETLIVKIDEISILSVDMRRLQENAWLNDNIIDAYIRLICNRSKENPLLPKVHGFGSFFFESYVRYGYNRVKRYTKSIDIFSYDIVLIPIVDCRHWCLVALDFRTKEIICFDSLGKEDSLCLALLHYYIDHETLEKKKSVKNERNWTVSFRANIPKQKNLNDCGVFTCLFADYVSRDAPINFNGDDMSPFRKRIAFEILHKKLL